MTIAVITCGVVRHHTGDQVWGNWGSLIEMSLLLLFLGTLLQTDMEKKEDLTGQRVLGQPSSKLIY